MKRALLIALIVSAGLATGQPVSAQPWMTGERLVKLLGNVDPSTIPMTSSSPYPTRAVAAEYLDMSNGQFVRGYIQAVHDTTEGKQWCPSRDFKPLPHELEDDARRALQQLSSAQLKRNAAELIVEVWKKTWPCPEQ